MAPTTVYLATADTTGFLLSKTCYQIQPAIKNNALVQMELVTVDQVVLRKGLTDVHLATADTTGLPIPATQIIIQIHQLTVHVVIVFFQLRTQTPLKKSSKL